MDANADSRWLIVGLGNPGEAYEPTRHNAGFMVIEKLASEYGVRVRRKECRALVGRGVSRGKAVELAKPQTYMNLSGEAVSCLLKKAQRAGTKLLVIVDDLALPFGSLRIRRKGSAGGHNGLRSIADCLKTENFARLRLGISPEHPVGNAKRFVLESFTRAEREALPDFLELAADAAAALVDEGIDRAMSRYN